MTSSSGSQTPCTSNPTSSTAASPTQSAPTWARYIDSRLKQFSLR